jgi:hypothetical protein
MLMEIMTAAIIMSNLMQTFGIMINLLMGMVAFSQRLIVARDRAG